jgi:2,3-bisphosphoglycerate-independent phosphoglycerate mutase
MTEENKKTVLLILDGWGINPNKEQSAIAKVNPPVFNQLLKDYPNSHLEASGKAVGLPIGVMGNSEVGHENIGAGRVSKQKLTLISEAIENKSFFQNQTLQSLFSQIKAANKKLHLIGLLSEGDVHSHLGHLYALIDWAERENISFFVHPILDGRDDPQKNCLHLLKDLQSKLSRTNNGKIGSVCGRYWAMDRDNNWERIKKYWNLLTKNQGLISQNPTSAVQEAYTRPHGLYTPAENSDEFIQPTYFVGLDSTIKNGDGVIFFNFRPDRARQITTVLTQNNFTGFERDIFPQINYVCLTSYDNSLDCAEAGANPIVPVAFHESSFPAQDKSLSLGEIVSEKGLKQLRIAETEKFRHVTSFFNQSLENPFDGEERILIPSPKVATYDMQPEMSLPGIMKALINAIESDKFDLIVANFANADMVGHSGIFTAASKAIEYIDLALKDLSELCLKKKVNLLITADHGNADQMINPDGSIRTAHSLNLVPFILVSEEYKNHKLQNGALSDIAPTILKLMHLEKPDQMTGKSLLNWFCL